MYIGLYKNHYKLYTHLCKYISIYRSMLTNSSTSLAKPWRNDPTSEYIHMEARDSRLKSFSFTKYINTTQIQDRVKMWNCQKKGLKIDWKRQLATLLSAKEFNWIMNGAANWETLQKIRDIKYGRERGIGEQMKLNCGLHAELSGISSAKNVHTYVQMYKYMYKPD